MTLTFNDDDRKKIRISATSSIDLSSCTIALKIDGINHACAWTGAAVETTPGTWTRPAVTSEWFAGPSVPAGKVRGATVLAAGTHQPEVIVEHQDGAIIAAVLPRFRIDVT